MALIYRSIFEVDDPEATVVDRAQVHARDWLRYKLSQSQLDLPVSGVTQIERHGIEVETRSGADDDCSVVRIAALTNRFQMALCRRSVKACGSIRSSS